MAAHEGAFMSLFTRQLGEQRVLPSQDSEDTQQQFSCARPHSIKVFLPMTSLMWGNVPGALLLYCTASNGKLGEGLGTRLSKTSVN